MNNDSKHAVVSGDLLIGFYAALVVARLAEAYDVGAVPECQIRQSDTFWRLVTCGCVTVGDRRGRKLPCLWEKLQKA